MSLSPVSFVAVAIILSALGIAWSKRFLAVGCLAVANLAIFLMSQFGPVTQVGSQMFPTVMWELGLHPFNLVDRPGLGILQLFTSMFVHAGWGHIIGNLLILLAFALPFEERIGGRRFVLIYLASGLVGSLVQVVSTAGDADVLVGASGAIFGIIGAFAASYPNVIVPLPLPLMFIMIFVRMRVWIAALVFSIAQVALYSISNLSGGFDATAYMAHFGGLVGGIILGVTVVRGRSGTARRPVAVDLDLLAPFARDAGTGQALSMMRENHDEPEIFQAWLDRFFRSATCPTCKHKVMPRHHGEIVCTQGHQFDVRKDRSGAKKDA